MPMLTKISVIPGGGGALSPLKNRMIYLVEKRYPKISRVQFTVKKIDSLEGSPETNISKDDALITYSCNKVFTSNYL